MRSAERHRRMIAVPAAFAGKHVDGQGRAWLAALPGMVEDLLDLWSCVPDGPTMHGEVGIVVPVRPRALPPAVIKISYPRPDIRHEPDAFTVWNGRGAVHLHERDDDRCAMLLERAGATLATVTDPEKAIAIQGALTRRLAVEAPAGLPRLSDQARDWARSIRATTATLGDPLPGRVVDAALATLRDLGPDQPNLLVHGDLHDANVLASEREPWLAIDPKCVVGDPARDALDVIRSPRFDRELRAANPKARILRLLDIYCDAAELDPVRVRRWTQAGAVREALWGRVDGDPGWLVFATDQLAEALT
ncbi:MULTISPECIES: aminoglycoside phosphotransferase family protein [unclassified Nocardia]|uniref:aminoglycoside phosphotransferase family protein n=1 Tax=unclassified Nocardia TaxID=2637762 RepID=UPI0033A1E2BB